MAKVWKIVVIVAAAVLLLGAICIGVAFLTGADPWRLLPESVVYFHVKDILNYFGFDMSSYLSFGFGF